MRDGDRYTVVLDCGDTFDLYHHDGIEPAKIGHYFPCGNHSPIVGYDPDNGWPIHDRVQQVVRIDPHGDQS